MQVLDSSIDFEGFLASLGGPTERALLLDYDGTLAPFCADRDQALPYPEVAEILNQILQSQHTRVVLISGRAIADLLPLLEGIRPLPEIWGSHGWERRDPSGQQRPVMLPGEVIRALASARQCADAAGFGDRCEFKPISVALHWRGLEASAQEKLRERAVLSWEPIIRSVAVGELELHDFDGGIELRAAGRNKGDAVRSILSDLPAGAAVAHLGDDRTDEEAFAALKPRGLCVLVRNELRPTLAHIWLRPPEELVDFLTRWHQISTNKR
jgi:trehalose-phosphatase